MTDFNSRLATKKARDGRCTRNEIREAGLLRQLDDDVRYFDCGAMEVLIGDERIDETRIEL